MKEAVTWNKLVLFSIIMYSTFQMSLCLSVVTDLLVGVLCPLTLYHTILTFNIPGKEDY